MANTNNQIRELLTGPTCLVRQFMSLIGLLTAKKKKKKKKNTGSPRSTAYEAFSVAPQTNWRVPESLEKVIPVPRLFHPPFKMVMEESNVLQGQPLHPLNILCNCLQMHQKKAGALKQSHRKGNLVPSRKPATHKLPGTKGSLLDPKRVQQTTPQWLPI